MYMCMMRKRGFKDVLRKSYFTEDSDENNDKKAEVVAFFTFGFCG